jgi:DNA-binding CsgD family transcriptional regulator
MSLSEHTARDHLMAIFAKTSASDRVKATYREPSAPAR